MIACFPTRRIPPTLVGIVNMKAGIDDQKSIAQVREVNEEKFRSDVVDEENLCGDEIARQ